MLAAAALRGCHVVIIAPALANAPSPEPPVIALEREMLSSLLALRDRYGDRIERAGGELRIGLYAPHAPVSDVAGRLTEVRGGLARAPWIRQLIPLDDATIAAIDRATAQASQTETETILAKDETPREPQLHQKTELVARPGAIAALVRQPGWGNALAQSLTTQSTETARLADALAAPLPAADTAAIRAADDLLQGYHRSLPEAEQKRLDFYFIVGSQNHDDRGLALDGESALVVSGFDASAGLVDLFYLMARTTWVGSTRDIDALLPAPRGIFARLARLVHFAM
jgi:hypothetical protein